MKLLYPKHAVAVLFFSLICFLGAKAQFDPQYSHYMFNKMVYNPAVAGSGDMGEATLLLRNQWLGLTDGTPVTQNLMAHLPWAAVHGGVGISLVNDMLGAERNTAIRLAYAFQQDFNFGRFALGVGGGVTQYTLRGSELVPPTPDQDDAIPVTDVSAIAPDFDVGLFFSRKDLYLGVSTTHLSEQDVSFSTGTGGTINVSQVRHLYFSGGYNLGLTPLFDLAPSFLMKTDNVKGMLDLSALVIYNKNLWMGVSFRGITSNNPDAAVALVGFNLTDNLRLGYSFDLILSNIRSFSAGTHEFMLNHKFRAVVAPPPSRIIHCPRWL